MIGPARVILSILIGCGLVALIGLVLLTICN